MNNFDRDFNRMRWLVGGVFAFIAVAIVCIFTLYGVIAYTIMKDPGVIGETAGTIVKRFNDTSK